MPEVVGEESQQAFVIHLFDEIVVSRLPEIRREIERLEPEKHPEVLIDLEYVTFFDSSGLGYLVILLKRIHESGSSVALCNPSALVLKLLKMAKIDEYVEILEKDLNTSVNVQRLASSDAGEVTKDDLDDLEDFPFKSEDLPFDD